jgi:hypothetical protein
LGPRTTRHTMLSDFVYEARAFVQPPSGRK